MIFRSILRKNERKLTWNNINGGGRSGAFLALDANLELMKKTGQLDVYEYAKTLVNSRPHLIDSVDQYTFIYDALAEAVLCNVQPIQMHQLKDRSSMYKAKKNRELLDQQESHENKLLMQLTHHLRIGDCAGGHRLENRGKNRDVMVVPPDHARPYLQTLHGESKDYTYINAVEVDGFTRKAEFIVTEWPKASTIDSFWTLIYDHSCHTVVNLSNQGNPRHYPTFIHNKGKANYGPFIVEVLNYHQYPAMTSHMVKVMKRVDPPTKGNKGPPKVPTLEGHPAYQVNRPMVMPGQSFRFKPMYRGRFRELSHVPMDASIMSEDGTGGTSGNRLLASGSSLPRTQSCGIVFDDDRFNEVQQYRPEHSIHNHPQPNPPIAQQKTFGCKSCSLMNLDLKHYDINFLSVVFKTWIYFD
ncbi:hypothetical protein WR25_00972 [Diploscapter pachys]|uniref:Tyrosine-protein phosphatase domain-containing protein n=1 Tax=Diploscapter pachys TaxID=2018661 RepID=A0A2A2JVT8_9BILA|nr:hypothetical protein WR25_00972 [Diploscapter pachys]